MSRGCQAAAHTAASGRGESWGLLSSLLPNDGGRPETQLRRACLGRLHCALRGASRCCRASQSCGSAVPRRLRLQRARED